MSDATESQVDFVILTALEEERDAVHERLPGLRQVVSGEEDVRVYFRSDLPVTFIDGSTGIYRIATLSLAKMGRVNATAATSDAIRRWNPRYLLLIGIAGGIAEREVGLGDVLVSDQIVDYELQKQLPEGPEVRYDVHRADQRLLEAASNFRDKGWLKLIKKRRPVKGQPTRHIGPIATGDKVVASAALDRYRNVWPKLIGVEMEAGGAATASFQSARRPGFFMVRGVSDLADAAKDSPEVDRWRPYACAVAASYAIALLRSGPVPLAPGAETTKGSAGPPALSEAERAQIQEDIRHALGDGLINGLMAICFASNQGRTEATLWSRIKQDPSLAEVLQFTVALSLDSSPSKRSESKLIAQVQRSLPGFFRTPEFDMVVRQMYSTRLVQGLAGEALEAIYTELIACLSLHLGEPEPAYEGVVRSLLDTLMRACGRVVELCSDGEPFRSQAEFQKACRNQLLHDELKGISKSLALLTAPTRPDVRSAVAFEQAFRQQVAERHGAIRPPNFDTARKLPIDRIYVPPDFAAILGPVHEAPTEIGFSSFVTALHRAVLLGNPGGGKSTFTLKLAYDLATRPSERLLAGRQVTPILVVLRNYGAAKKDRRCSILQFLELTAHATYQIPPPPGAFEYLLLSGRVVVIFDGLDELLDTSYRQQIGEDIELFCTQYSAIPVLVTSREVGYDQAPLDRKRFDHYRLAPFRDEQVKTYVGKWFDADIDLTLEQRRQKADAFMEESQAVPDLRSNPLMLALLCNIYRGEGYIPQKRPLVHEKCATMLFERWDKDRGLKPPLAIEDKIDPAMKYLAYWIYSDENLQGGVTEEDLVSKVIEYLIPRRFEDRDAAERAAREFVAFCRGRAWVFTDTGLKKGGESLFQFTHRTFLEYFAAAHLARSHATALTLGRVLRPRVARKEWDVVAQLALQIKNKEVEGAGDQILQSFVTETGKVMKAPSWSQLSFAARCLEFLIPSPKVTRKIAEACVERCLAWGVDLFAKNRGEGVEGDAFGEGTPIEMLGPLLSADDANRPVVAQCFEQLIAKCITVDIQPKAFLALEIGLNLDWIHTTYNRRTGRKGVTSEWRAMSKSYLDQYREAARDLSRSYPSVCSKVFYEGLVTLPEMLAHHEMGFLFKKVRLLMLPGFSFLSIAENCLIGLYRTSRIEDWPFDSNLQSIISDFSKAALSHKSPWVDCNRARRDDLTMIFFPSLPDQTMPGNLVADRSTTPDDVGTDVLFGAFGLMAVQVELELGFDMPQPSQIIPWLATNTHSLTVVLRSLLLARNSREHPDGSVSDVMDRCRFTTEQRSFVERWVRGELSLVRLPEVKPRKSSRTPRRHNATASPPKTPRRGRSRPPSDL